MKNNKDKLKLIASSASHQDVVDLNVNIVDDLNMDSLDVISFLFEVENEFNIKVPEEDVDKYELLNLNNFYNYISNCKNTA
jgi:acyl carrier protein